MLPIIRFMLAGTAMTTILIKKVPRYKWDILIELILLMVGL